MVALGVYGIMVGALCIWNDIYNNMTHHYFGYHFH